MAYQVSTVEEIEDRIVTAPVGRYEDKPAAMRAARRAAGKGAKFSGSYGPDAVAYIGAITAVVAW